MGLGTRQGGRKPVAPGSSAITPDDLTRPTLTRSSLLSEVSEADRSRALELEAKGYDWILKGASVAA